MVRRAARILARLLPTFALGFAVAAGGWGYYLRSSWPDWPGGRVDFYDQQAASGFPLARNHRLSPFDYPPSTDDQLAGQIESSGDTNSGPAPQLATPAQFIRDLGRTNFTPVLHDASRSLGDVVEAANERSRVEWSLTLQWTTRFSTPWPMMTARPGITLARPGEPPCLAGAGSGVQYPSYDPITGFSWPKIGLFSKVIALFRFRPVLPSVAASGSASPLRRHLGRVWLDARDRDGSERPLYRLRDFDPAAEGGLLPEPEVYITVNPRRPAGVSRMEWDAVLVVGSGGDPRQQAAVADELRRLIITEIVADVTLAGVGGGVAGAAVFAVASGVVARVRRRRRLKAGRCVGCGYDLFGSAHSGRCPECGRETR